MNRRSFLGGSGLTAGGIILGGSPFRLIALAGGENGGGSPSGVIETSAGKLRGLQKGGVYAYKGLHYGASTAGARRFLPPAKPEPWMGVRDAFELGLRAPQLSHAIVPEWGAFNRSEPMGEDCLVLNVWTPSPDKDQKRPVMVWLHGGGFATGSAGFVTYDGANLARRHDVVVVTVNHRLNVFGFLYLPEIGGRKYANASNVGMLDIVAALQWVRDNIPAFGGDPGNVTIFGQSGGGGKVSTLLAMPAAKSLFHRAIAESGSEVDGLCAAEATKSAERFMALLGLKPNQVDEAQKLPMERLLAAMDSHGGDGLGLSPVVDMHSLPANPFDPVAPAISADVPFLIGSNETEVTFFPNRNYNPLDSSALQERVKSILKTDAAQADHVIAVYRKERPKASNLDLALIIETDASNFRIGVDTEAVRKSAQNGAPVYMYRFTRYSPVRGGVLRAMHTMEIPFVFDNVDIARGLVGSGQAQNTLAEQMSRAWVAFARSGTPNHSGLPNWRPFDRSTRATMIFNAECKLVNDPYGEERRIVESLKREQHRTSA